VIRVRFLKYSILFLILCTTTVLSQVPSSIEPHNKIEDMGRLERFEIISSLLFPVTNIYENFEESEPDISKCYNGYSGGDMYYCSVNPLQGDQDTVFSFYAKAVVYWGGPFGMSKYLNGKLYINTTGSCYSTIEMVSGCFSSNLTVHYYKSLKGSDLSFGKNKYTFSNGVTSITGSGPYVYSTKITPTLTPYHTSTSTPATSPTITMTPTLTAYLTPTSTPSTAPTITMTATPTTTITRTPTPTYTIPPSSDQFYVDAVNGSNSNSGTTSSDAWQTITFALAQFDPGSDNPAVINIASGTYNESLGEIFPIRLKENASIVGSNKDTTIIDASDSKDGVIGIYDGINYYLKSLTIKGGYSEGGIYCYGHDENTSPLIEDCIIMNNEGGEGGGLTFYNSSPIITNCIIKSNQSTDFGGGIWSYNSSLTIDSCLISSNKAVDGGYGISLENKSSAIITNCVIAGNRIDNDYEPFGDGAIYCSSSLVSLMNSNIVNNTGWEYSGLIAGSSSSVKNCIFWGNDYDWEGDYYNDHGDLRPIKGEYVHVTYSNVEGGYPGEGNININPLFTKGPEGKYYLSQIASGQSNDSPCVDAGSDYSEIFGMHIMTTRTDEQADTGIVDMGYHHPSYIIPTPTLTPTITQTITPTITVTYTLTPTFTLTTTPTLTTTTTPSQTPTISSTITETPTLTATTSPTITLTSTCTLTSTLTPTLTSTPWNEPPNLEEIPLRPPWGNKETTFEYNVHYFDPDGLEPWIKRVYINNNPFKMNLISGESADGIYRLKLSGDELLTNNDYFFYFMDNEGKTVRLPMEETFAGPDVENAPLPEMTPIPFIEKWLPYWEVSSFENSDTFMIISNPGEDYVDGVIEFYNRSGLQVGREIISLEKNKKSECYLERVLRKFIQSENRNNLWGSAKIMALGNDLDVLTQVYNKSENSKFDVQTSQLLHSPVTIESFSVHNDKIDTLLCLNNPTSKEIDFRVSLIDTNGNLIKNIRLFTAPFEMLKLHISDFFNSKSEQINGSIKIEWKPDEGTTIFALIKNKITGESYPIETNQD